MRMIAQLRRERRAGKPGRRPLNAFEVMLEKWQRGEDVSWGQLFAAWLKTPTAPRSPDTVRRVIRKVEWIG